MAITLINPFTVPADQDEEFLKRWKQTSDVLSRAEGFIDAHMYKNTGAGEFLYINVAQWESADAVQRAHAGQVAAAGEGRLPGVRAHPGVFTPVVTVSPQGNVVDASAPGTT